MDVYSCGDKNFRWFLVFENVLEYGDDVSTAGRGGVEDLYQVQSWVDVKRLFAHYKAD